MEITKESLNYFGLTLLFYNSRNYKTFIKNKLIINIFNPSIRREVPPTWGDRAVTCSFSQNKKVYHYLGELVKPSDTVIFPFKK